MLDAHPQLAIPPETGFVVPIARMPLPAINAKDRFFRIVTQAKKSAQSWPDFGIRADEFWSDLSTISSFDTSKGCRLFYERYAARFGKTRWGDKTPGYCRHQLLIEKLLPEARFIHIIRDGRDVALSLRKQWFAPSTDIAALAARWRDDIIIARKQGARCKHYMEVRYERLIVDTPAVLRSICKFLALPFDDAMLRYHERAAERIAEHQGRYRPDGSAIVTPEVRRSQQALVTRVPDTSRIYAWRETMTQDEQHVFAQTAGALIDALGYSTADPI